MKKRTFLIFVAYIWSKTLVGLTFHPFSTIQKLTRRPILLPTILTPLLGLFMLFLLGRIGALLITFYEFKREIIAIILSTALISMLFWQILLIYLLISFFTAFWKR